MGSRGGGGGNGGSRQKKSAPPMTAAREKDRFAATQAPAPSPAMSRPTAVAKSTPAPAEKAQPGVTRTDTAKALEQLQAREKAISDSPIGKVPGLASLAGGAVLSRQISELEKPGSYAVVAPGTGYEAQGQRYSQLPGQTPEGFAERISATKPARGSGEGYIGDVAGVSSVQKIGPVEVRTFTGKAGYSPTGEKEPQREERGGGAPADTTVTTAPTQVSGTITPAARRKSVQALGSGGAAGSRKVFF